MDLNQVIYTVFHAEFKSGTKIGPEPPQDPIFKDFLKLCFNSNLATEITLQPLKRFNLDAAIIFSDILVIPYALKQKIEFREKGGPWNTFGSILGAIWIIFLKIVGLFGVLE